MTRRRPSEGASLGEIRETAASNKAMDAYNAGYRRGLKGLPADDGSRFSSHENFAAGYADGHANRTKGES